MTERLRHLGGSLQIYSDTHGTVVTASPSPSKSAIRPTRCNPEGWFRRGLNARHFKVDIQRSLYGVRGNPVPTPAQR